MNGQADRRRRVPTAARLFVRDQRRDQGGLPVVDMEHLRLPGQIAGQVDHAFGEENETFRVVGIIGAPFGI